MGILPPTNTYLAIFTILNLYPPFVIHFGKYFYCFFTFFLDRWIFRS